MFTNYMNWRKENNVDTVLDDFEFTEKAQLMEIYPMGYHGLDKQGRPIYIERFGTLDVPKIFTITTEERMLKFYQSTYEYLLKFRFPVCSELAGRKI